MKITGFRIPVSDISQAVPFYRDILGFEVVFEAAEYGWATIEMGEAQLGLYVPGMGGGNRQPGGTVDFAFVVDELEGYHQRAAASANVGQIQKTADGMKIFDVLDPDGNELVFRQS